ncbi:DUF1963 domain-containing protein [Erysipelotrichaceae bacterium OttesenSCG-928-M19]|nr:DUF1963 domain-containing protein [Erysipelotrichaceae bacterium OttesenSCG-928-M19]
MEQTISNIYNKVAQIKETIIIKESNDICKAWDSKVGGKAYLLEDDEYPVSFDSSETFEFLIQINCNDLPDNELFPKKGLLQFFINHEYSFEKEDKPFEIRYIENIITDDDLLDYDIEDEYDEDDNPEVDEDDDNETMIEEEIKITFEKAFDHINSTTIEWDSFKGKMASALYEYRDELDDYDSMIKDSNYLEDLDFILDDEKVLEVMHSSKLLGYPDNFDEDIRLSDYKYHDYILLLQLSLAADYFDNEDETNICWFIKEEDLKALNFNNVICSYFR